MDKYYFGIDIGGTFIKGAIVDSKGNIVSSHKIPTERSRKADALLNIPALCNTLAEKAGLPLSAVSAIGIGVPGMVDSKNGRVIVAENVGWKNLELGTLIEKALKIPAKITNDANAAALGELSFGFGGKYKNMIMLTLGTGVGGGIIINGEIYEGNLGAGAEIGHSVMVMDGERCSCGRHGCIEAYCSATALIRDTKRAMQENPDSLLWELGSLDAVNGKSAFDYCGRDIYAKKVVDGYIRYLACAITNMANIFRPEAVVIGGGISAQGKALTEPLKRILNEEIYAKDLGPSVEVVTARLKNDAGTLGAAALAMKKI